MSIAADKKADLAGPGIGDYAELEKTLPSDRLPQAVRPSTRIAPFHETGFAIPLREPPGHAGNPR